MALEGLLVRQGLKDVILHQDDLATFTKLRTGAVLQKQSMLLARPWMQVCRLGSASALQTCTAAACWHAHGTSWSMSEQAILWGASQHPRPWACSEQSHAALCQWPAQGLRPVAPLLCCCHLAGSRPACVKEA